MVPLYMFGIASSNAVAAPLTPAQIQAIDQYTFWIGDSTCLDTSSTSDTTLTGADNGQKMWNFFLAQGLTPNEVAGVMGNLFAQDGSFNPEQVQKPPGGNSTTPTTQHDLGWGLAQWTPTSGPNPIISAGQQAGVPYDQLDTLAGQLTIILWEMKNSAPAGGQDILKTLKTETTVAQSTSEFWTYFEGGGPNVPSQIFYYSSQMLKIYGKGNGSTTPTTNPVNGGSCSTNAPTINCTSSSQASSTLSPLRQNIVCLAKQQSALWASKPLSYRYHGFWDYSNNSQELWCADFVSWIYKNAGDAFTGGARDGWDVSYVGYIPGVSAHSASFTYHPVGGKPYTPQPGDIGIFYTNQPFGHTAIYIGNSAGTSVWIGGDQGPSPNGAFGDQSDSESTVDVGYNEPGAPGYIMGYVSPNGN
jgi:hypothetical protein